MVLFMNALWFGAAERWRAPTWRDPSIREYDPQQIGGEF